LGVLDLDEALSKLGSKAEVLDKDDNGGKILPSSETGKRAASYGSNYRSLLCFYSHATSWQSDDKDCCIFFSYRPVPYSL
jgi:hypothetical protein